MRINQYVAHATGMSRRAADALVTEGRIQVNNQVATTGQQVTESDIITLDNASLKLPAYRLVVFHKPVGYVTSRKQQGTAPTIYGLLPEELHDLKPVGRLDKDSSGLLLLTNDGELAQTLQHPSSGKWKRYEVRIDRPLPSNLVGTLCTGVQLDDGESKMEVVPLSDTSTYFEVRLQEGRNRQIRRSFEAVGVTVTGLHRTDIGEYALGDLTEGEWRTREVI